MYLITASKEMKQKLAELKGEIAHSLIIITGFNTSCSAVDKPTMHTHKDLNSTTSHFDLHHTYRTLCPTSGIKYILFQMYKVYIHQYRQYARPSNKAVNLKD